MAKPTTPDLSIIVTAHAEGILLHKAFASIRRAAELLQAHFSYELILHLDNPTEATLAYVSRHKSSMLADVILYTNHFGDPAPSRNFAIKKASGRYVALVDGDDIISQKWLINALRRLSKDKSDRTVAHSEKIVEFGVAHAVVDRHGAIGKASDTILSVFANRWGAPIIAPRALLLQEPYVQNDPGFGYEDWQLNNRFIAKGIQNVLIPETALFVRRKEEDSVWDQHRQSIAVLRRNPLLEFENVRSIRNPFLTQTSRSTPAGDSLKGKLKSLLKQHPTVHRVAQGLYNQLRPAQPSASPDDLPAWLTQEWRALHQLEKDLFPLASVPVFNTISPDHIRVGSVYKQLVDALRFNTYDYVIFAPWLIRGGADLYVINYANAVASLQPTKRVLVLTTLPGDSPWRHRLHPEVDFLAFGEITRDLTSDQQQLLLGHLIENGGMQRLHIINSALGYDFVKQHRTYLKSTGRKVIVTSFSQSTDESGRLFGYSHTHVPKIYEAIDVITSDNQTVITMWEQEYGFDPRRMFVHRQPVTLPAKTQKKSSEATLRILWAARLAPEKQPEVVARIGRLLQSANVQIDMYGHVYEDFDTRFLETLPANVAYKGPYDGPESLPRDQYDAYLYTSLFDGMPNTLLEMASARLPIISSDVGGISEFVQHRKTGYLVKDVQNASAYADAIREIIANRELLDTWSSNAYQLLETDFSEKSFSTAVKTMLKKLEA